VLRNLRNRIASLGDLGYRVPFELVTEITIAPYGLHAPNLGEKASMNLGAVHLSTSAWREGIVSG